MADKEIESEKGTYSHDSEDSEDTELSSSDESEITHNRNKHCGRIRFMNDVIGDLKARAPLYVDDWKRPNSILKVLNATFVAFFAQLIIALIFAVFLEQKTNGTMAISEVLLGTGIIGIIYALLSGQPLTLVGITGPVVLLLGTSYGLAEQLGTDYHTFFWWLCIWLSILHVLSAAFGLVNFVWSITPFTSQIFEFFIAMSFIYESTTSLIEPIHPMQTKQQDQSASDGDQQRAVAYASLVIGILTFFICWTLHFAENWKYFTRQARTHLASYNMIIAVFIATGFSYLPGVAQDYDKSSSNAEIEKGIDRINIPASSLLLYNRNSLVTDPIKDMDTNAIFFALIPAAMLFILFFIDHNISSILTQAPKYNLTKPPAYHWDFFVLGLTIIPCAFLGIIPAHGQIPQGPMHTQALCTRTRQLVFGSDERNGVSREVVTHCEEQRWSAFFQAALLLVALHSSVSVISWIPIASLFGVFLYMGVAAMHGNEVWERIMIMFMVPKNRPDIPVVTEIWETKAVHTYTLIQVILASLTFYIAHFAPNGYIFPLVIALAVPLRTFLLPYLFEEESLKYLDPQDDKLEVEEHTPLAQRPSLVDEPEAIHQVGSFRPKKAARDAEEFKRDKSLIEEVAQVFRVDVEANTVKKISNSSTKALSPRRRNSKDEEPYTLRKVGARRPASTGKDNTNTFISSIDYWAGMLGLYGSDLEEKNDDVRSVRSIRSARSVLFDADDMTIKSSKSYQSHTVDIDEMTSIRSMRSTKSEVYDADDLTVRSMRSTKSEVSDGGGIRGMPSAMTAEFEELEREEEEEDEKAKKKSRFVWRKNNVRKYADATEQVIRPTSKQAPDLDFDADKVIVPESILRSNTVSKRVAGRSIKWGEEDETKATRFDLSNKASNEFYDA